ncbi:hypothetical protein ACSBR2_004216 [Camellia fascicularis]
MSTPSGRTTTVASIYRACFVVIENVELFVDLVPLNITYFDLVANHASINCVSKSVTFKPPHQAEVTFQGKGLVSLPYLISSMKAYQFIQKRCQGYLCCVLSNLNGNIELHDIQLLVNSPTSFRMICLAI